MKIKTEARVVEGRLRMQHELMVNGEENVPMQTSLLKVFIPYITLNIPLIFASDL